MQTDFLLLWILVFLGHFMKQLVFLIILLCTYYKYNVSDSVISGKLYN